jgi:hypothetical protein
MHIRQLARNAALIMVAAILTAGFSTGIAQATNAAPASTASAVAPGGSTTPRMLPGCTPQPQFCSYDSSIHGLILTQKFGCTINRVHTAVNTPVFELVNGCGTAVDYYYKKGGGGCINAHSAQSGAGRFSAMNHYWVSFDAKC